MGRVICNLEKVIHTLYFERQLYPRQVKKYTAYFLLTLPAYALSYNA